MHSLKVVNKYCEAEDSASQYFYFAKLTVYLRQIEKTSNLLYAVPKKLDI